MLCSNVESFLFISNQDGVNVLKSERLYHLLCFFTGSYDPFNEVPANVFLLLWWVLRSGRSLHGLQTMFTSLPLTITLLSVF